MLFRIAARALAYRRSIPAISTINSLPIRTSIPLRTFAVKAAPKTTRAATKPKAKAKPRAKGKPKKVAAKPKAKAKKPKRKPKKPETEEEIAAAAKKSRLSQIRELRTIALKRPSLLPSTAYLVVCAELTKEQKSVAGKAAAAKYKNLAPEELEHYNHIANQNKAKNEKTIKTWVESHSAEDIRRANVARKHLKRLGVKGYSSSIHDTRQVKRPPTALSLFLKERYSTGDMHGMSPADAARIISREWKDLPATDKQKYYASELEFKEQYKKDVKKVYQRDVQTTPGLAAKALGVSS